MSYIYCEKIDNHVKNIDGKKIVDIYCLAFLNVDYINVTCFGYREVDELSGVCHYYINTGFAQKLEGLRVKQISMPRGAIQLYLIADNNVAYEILFKDILRLDVFLPKSIEK